MLHRATAFALVGFATVASEGHARADYDFQVAFGGGVRWLRGTPSLRSSAVSTYARELAEGDAPMRGGLTMIGGFLDLGLTIDDRFMVPLFGGAVWTPLGPYDGVVTSVDGSIVRARPWTAFSAEALLPGVGYRLKRRRWMFGASLRTGASWLEMEGVVASGAIGETVALSSSSFFLQAELEACRRLDPTTRVCLEIAPRIYEYELLNGGLVQLRVEWGN
jgi:hypothetical protein